MATRSYMSRREVEQQSFPLPVAIFVPVGAILALSLGRRKLRGQVKYCLQNEIGYFAGIEFAAGQRWSRKIYEPKHLLDPAQVLARGAKS